MQVVIIFLYSLSLFFIFLFSCAQLGLVVSYYRRKKEGEQTERERYQTTHQAEYKVTANLTKSAPFVTIQLPIYNERYVVERLIDNVAQMDYPRNRFEIQVLDDSTDDTSALTAGKVAEWIAQGVTICHIRRPERTGFKAGALAYGLESAQGEFIAIFDADFLPNPDFLTQTLPHFTTPKVGVVQTRWGHLNQVYSFLTDLQAFGLNGHFVVEQTARHAGHHFINFNGTAGVWRKACIEDAGGWSADTLTEDLDLSYRAQLRGWEFIYLEHIETPAELPATMPALRSQQYRWMKGAAECARKNLFNLLKNDRIGGDTKFFGFFHLLNSSVFIWSLTAALLSVPALWISVHSSNFSTLFQLAQYAQASFLGLGIFYWTANRRQRSLLQIVVRFPFFLAVMMGLSLHNALAVLEGYLGRKTPFVRTPKWGIRSANDRWQQKEYQLKSINPITYFEIGLMLYFVLGGVLALYWQTYNVLPFFVLLTFGYGFVSFYSVKHASY